MTIFTILRCRNSADCLLATIFTGGVEDIGLAAVRVLNHLNLWRLACLTLIALVAFCPVQHGVIDAIEREGPAIYLSFRISVWLDGWCLTILTVSRCWHDTYWNLLAIFIGVVEAVAGNFTIRVSDRFDLRRLTVFAVLRCLNSADCRFFAIVAYHEEFVTGGAIFTDLGTDLRCLTRFTLFTLVYGDGGAIREGDLGIAGFINDRTGDCQRCRIFTIRPVNTVFTICAVLAVLTVLNGVINAVKGERVAVDIALAVSVWLDFRRLTIFWCFNVTGNYLLTLIIEIEEVVTSDLAIAVLDCFKLRCLAIFTSSAILWCFDRANRGFIAILIGDVEFVVGRAIFTLNCANFRCLTVLTVNPVFTICTFGNRDLRAIGEDDDCIAICVSNGIGNV